MCTLSLHRASDMLLVTMNRDEARTRGPEAPPELWSCGTPILAPRDSDGGGTWMGLNEEGVVACLLNQYDDQKRLAALNPALSYRSRGLIIPEVLDQGGFEACLAYVRDEIDPRPYMPFTLVLAALAGIWTFTWHGQGTLEIAEHDDTWTMFSSSFFDTRAVLTWRRNGFDAWRANGAPMIDGVPAFHLSQPGGKVEWAPLMEREVSATRSITQAIVHRGQRAHVLRWSPVVHKRISMNSVSLAQPVGNGSPPG